jgi:hypothetical protein
VLRWVGYERSLLCQPFRPFTVRVASRPWLDEPRQSLCQPVGLGKPKSRNAYRSLPSIYRDNLFASNSMRGWHVLARFWLLTRDTGNRFAGNTMGGWHVKLVMNMACCCAPRPGCSRISASKNGRCPGHYPKLAACVKRSVPGSTRCHVLAVTRGWGQTTGTMGKSEFAGFQIGLAREGSRKIHLE